MARPKLFIDGEAGTTGLQIAGRIDALGAVDVVSIEPGLRKDADARAALYGEVDIVILCLPDDAARAAVALANGLGAKSPRIIDASTAHRIAEGWTYGFPELAPAQAAAIAGATRVSNPGCYPTGAIALLRPLVDRALIPADHPIAINAVSGYSGGGNAMIAAHEVAKSAPAFELYGLDLAHKHTPEIAAYAGLLRRPIFVPSVGNFRQGMVVSIPLHLDDLPGRPTTADLRAALAAHYEGASLVNVIGQTDTRDRLAADAAAGSDSLDLCVAGNDAHRQALLVAQLDNLGKGAAGAAVQNLKLMLGLP